MAQEAASRESATSKLRRLLAYDETSKRADVKVGDSAFFHKATNRKSAPRWLGPAGIPGIEDAGVAAKFHPQAFKVDR